MAVLNRIRIARLALSENPGAAQTRAIIQTALDEAEREILTLQLDRRQTADRLGRMSREMTE